MTLSLAGLSLRDLEYAAAVDRTRHFGRAAEACAVSPAALSEQLRKLEDRLATRLFERGDRRVEPTPRGVVLLRQIELVLSHAHGLVELAQASAERLAGPLRLGAIATLGPYYLPHLLRQAREALPRLSLQLIEGQTAELLDQLRRGSLDAVLLALPAPADWCTVDALFFEPFHLVCPAGHPVAAMTSLDLADLAGDDLLLLEKGHCLRDQALSLCANAGQGRLATSLETLWHMIAAGEGYSVLPALSTAGRDGLAGLVELHPLTDAAAGRTVAMAWRRTDPRGGEFSEFGAMLRNALPEGVTLP